MKFAVIYSKFSKMISLSTNAEFWLQKLFLNN